MTFQCTSNLKTPSDRDWFTQRTKHPNKNRVASRMQCSEECTDLLYRRDQTTASQAHGTTQESQLFGSRLSSSPPSQGEAMSFFLDRKKADSHADQRTYCEVSYALPSLACQLLCSSLLCTQKGLLFLYMSISWQNISLSTSLYLSVSLSPLKRSKEANSSLNAWCTNYQVAKFQTQQSNIRRNGLLWGQRTPAWLACLVMVNSLVRAWKNGQCKNPILNSTVHLHKVIQQVNLYLDFILQTATEYTANPCREETSNRPPAEL